MSHQRTEPTARDAYLQVADEFGVPEFIVRDICGLAGRANGIEFEERVALLRAKMENAAFVPVRRPYSCASAGMCGVDEEIQELRTCADCEKFLDDDDDGEPVDEDDDDSGILCRDCVTERMRL